MIGIFEAVDRALYLLSAPRIPIPLHPLTLSPSHPLTLSREAINMRHLSYRPPSQLTRFTLTLTLSLTLTACPERRKPGAIIEGERQRRGAQNDQEPHQGACARIGDRCRLKGGALGVCSPRAGEGLQCTPQH